MELMLQDNKMVIDSREVAEMVEKRHANLIRDIETYIQYMENSQLSYGFKSTVSEFFIEGRYEIEDSGRSYKKYDCTKKGCEFIAHKLTGQKGAIFTAKYIDRFHEMEKQITAPAMTIDLIIAAAQQLKAIEIKQLEQDKQLQIIQQEQKVLKGKVDIVNDKEFTIMGYANLHNIHVSNKTAAHLGRMAARLSNEQGYFIGSATHPVFGKVNTYHVDVLDQVLDEIC